MPKIHLFVYELRDGRGRKKIVGPEIIREVRIKTKRRWPIFKKKEEMCSDVSIQIRAWWSKKACHSPPPFSPQTPYQILKYHPSLDSPFILCYIYIYICTPYSYRWSPHLFVGIGWQSFRSLADEIPRFLNLPYNLTLK